VSDPLKLETVDADGAVRESAEAAGLDRSDFLRKGALAGGGLLAGGALFTQYLGPAEAAISTRRRSASNDVKILNYALTLEFLEAEFYRQAVAHNAFSSPQYARFGQVVAAHEAAHVKALRKALGSAATKKPTFDFGAAVTDQATFVKTAFVLENTGVHAYLGQAGKIKTPALLGAAASILTVEARHASAIALLIDVTNVDGPNGITPDGAFDVPWSKARVLKAVTATGFIKG
jgi:rubrerythrin